MDQKAEIEKREASILSTTTLEEKIGQLSQVRYFEDVTEVAASWLPGSEGDVVAGVLFGVHNIKGMLTDSWPKSENDFSGKCRPNFWNDTLLPLFSFVYACAMNKGRGKLNNCF